MFPFLRRAKPATGRTVSTPASTHLLWFDPARIVQGISFHLLDEGKARAINPESSQAAVDQLSQRFDRLTVSADRWAAMENPQRLQWLLDQSHIVVESASSGSATLWVRG